MPFRYVRKRKYAGVAASSAKRRRTMPYIRKRPRTGGRIARRVSRLPRVQAAGRRQAYRTATVARVLRGISEMKINQLTRINCQAPLPIVAPPGTTPIYKSQFYLGPPFTIWSGYTALQGFTFPEGTGRNERVGKFMYLKKTSLRLKIMMNTTGGTNPSPNRFRVIVFKTRANNIPGTFGGNPEENLFIDDKGDEFGVNNLGLETIDYEQALVNRKNYVVVRDSRFILQPSIASPLGSASAVPTSTDYPQEKYMSLSLGHYAKASFGVDNSPSDLNYRYAICILATPVGDCRAPAKEWTVSIRGTVSALDN